MIARDLLQEAVDELYGGDPAEFLTHRKELAAAARAAKDRDAAKAIAALRKPTRSAHLLNQLARREPERVDELLRLADDATAGSGRSPRDALRAMRELTARRRRLIDDLVDRAFSGAGDESPTPGIRDEVVATLNAAVGDPDVGAEWAEGRLVRSHEWSGFGFSAADLASVPDGEPDAEPDDDVDDDTDAESGDDHATDASDEEDAEDEDAEDEDAEDEDEESDDDSRDDDPEDDDSEDDGADDEADEEEDDPADPTAEARAALHEADRELKAQQRAEQDQQDRIAELEDELTEAQIRLDEIRLAIRRAEMVQRTARAALDRVGRRSR